MDQKKKKKEKYRKAWGSLEYSEVRIKNHFDDTDKKWTINTRCPRGSQGNSTSRILYPFLPEGGITKWCGKIDMPPVSLRILRKDAEICLQEAYWGVFSGTTVRKQGKQGWTEGDKKLRCSCNLGLSQTFRKFFFFFQFQ